MNKSDYLFIKAGTFFMPLIKIATIPNEQLYKWDEDKQAFVLFKSRAKV